MHSKVMMVVLSGEPRLTRVDHGRGRLLLLLLDLLLLLLVEVEQGD